MKTLPHSKRLHRAAFFLCALLCLTPMDTLILARILRMDEFYQVTRLLLPGLTGWRPVSCFSPLPGL